MTKNINTIVSAKEALKNNKIVLFMKGTPDKPGCGFSAHVVQILNKLNVNFLDIDVLNDNQFKETIILCIVSVTPLYPCSSHRKLNCFRKLALGVFSFQYRGA